ncbi:putative beta-lactamase HcpA [Photobacterium gaetbulicola Gung47]|uniref:Putative beta-lactamase HcpA n=1 Tax=Photobacterium gaetbulicola Gung47 TaxID=658445 RepID=A0A0C5WPM5_9GAMM|nr:putative beta-lactamase HcpA [Photobacterium gaetbulicola Gung47]
MCRVYQRGCRQARDTVDLNVNAIFALDLINQEVKVSITRQQNDPVDIRCMLHNVQGDPDIPITLRGAITALDKGFEFDVKADTSKDILELALFFVTTMNGIGISRDNLSALGGFGPKGIVIKVTTIGVFDGVVDVLHIDKNSDFFHVYSLLVGPKGSIYLSGCNMHA